MPNIVITKRQKKILLAVGIVTVALVFFVIFIYIPMKKRLIESKDKLYAVEADIQKIREIAGEGTSVEGAISALKHKLEDLDEKFPEKEEVILRELSGLASRLDIEVVSTKPQKKRCINEIKGIPISISACVVQEMPISMSLKATYKSLGDFIKALTEDFVIFVAVDNVRMDKPIDNAQRLLNIELELHAYLMTPSDG